MSTFETLKQIVSETEADYVKMTAGNKAARTRVNKAMQQIRLLAKTVRTEIAETRKAEKTK